MFSDFFYSFICLIWTCISLLYNYDSTDLSAMLVLGNGPQPTLSENIPLDKLVKMAVFGTFNHSGVFLCIEDHFDSSLLTKVRNENHRPIQSTALFSNIITLEPRTTFNRNSLKCWTF